MSHIEALRANTLPTEYVEGEWCLPGNHEPAAIVTYTEWPSPETGHVGWCWWARGRMGDAPTYEQAKREAERALQAVIDDRMAIL